jgi:hypothetical protein
VKDFWDWFIGSKASDVLYVTWDWLWGNTYSATSAEVLPTAAEMESDALVSLRQMVKLIERLEVAVALVRGHYVAAQNNYQACMADIQVAEQELYTKMGVESRLATDKIVILEQAAAQFLQQFQEAEENLCVATNQLLWEQQRAIAAQQQLTQVSAMQVLNASILQIAQQRDSLAVDSVQSQFDRATAAIALAAEQQKVLAETIDRPSPVLSDQICYK